MSENVTICAIFAHPDDESFGVSGTLAKYAGRGVRSALVCATRGEAGLSNGLAATPAALAQMRSAELACAAAVMDVEDLSLFDYPDGGAASWDREALAGQLRETIRRLRPAVLITFDPEGITRHPDHMAVHQVVRELVEREGEALGVRRLFYHVVTCPEQASPEGPSLGCVSPDAVEVTIDVSDFEATKRAALECHRTQAADTAQLLQLPLGSLSTELFVAGWSRDGWRPPAGCSDLLAGWASHVQAGIDDAGERGGV